MSKPQRYTEEFKLAAVKQVTKSWDTHLTPALTTHSPSTFLTPRDPRREPP